MPKKIDRAGWNLLPDGRPQTGWVEAVGKHMYGVFRVIYRLPDGSDREQKKRIKLGPATMGKKQAKCDLSKKIEEFYQHGLRGPSVPPTATSESKFSWLVDRYEANHSAEWAPGTKSTNDMYLGVLRDKLGQFAIQDFGEVEMQDYLRGWLGDLARSGKSRSYVQHILVYLRAALNEGVKRKLIHFNDADELKVPKRVKAVDESFLTRDETAAIRDYLRENGQNRDALIVEILFLCALRPGELFALRWDDWDEARPDRLRIDEAFGQHGLGDVKTKGSKGAVHLPPPLQAELREWKKWCNDSASRSFIFASKRNTPTRFENFRKRVLQPAAKAVGITRATHQMLRRSFSTELLDSGASPKDVQGQMRHAQASMSMYYGKVIPALDR